MNENMKSSWRIAALLLLIGIGVTGCAGVATAPSAALEQQIDTARSRGDHEVLVTRYNTEAATARAKAAEHLELGRQYAAVRLKTQGDGSMQAHCNATAASYEQIATRYDAMAASHREMGASAKP